jgi:phosphoribosylglycinamide formyltransferase-1
MKRIVIFASGSGTNAENIIHYFQTRAVAEVVHIFSNKAGARVLEHAQNLGVTATVFDKTALLNGTVLEQLHLAQPDLIVLAGFLWKFPKDILEHYPNKTINIHPALLPKYGGKGMYGMHVHKAVVANKESETGITIHYVNEFYDDGAIIFQAQCDVLPTDTAKDVAFKVHELEMLHFPRVIEKVLI